MALKANASKIVNVGIGLAIASTQDAVGSWPIAISTGISTPPPAKISMWSFKRSATPRARAS